jgi:tRNA-2-methylthio-N6-dimethylallyladenosine synthase
MNISDSERIATTLEENGYTKTQTVKKADLVVVVMCSVRQSAVDRVFGKVNNLKTIKKENPKLKTLLTGCILKSDYKKFEQYFDYIIPIKLLNEWNELLKENCYHYLPDQRSEYFYQKNKADYLQKKPNYSNSFSALVPISTGCDNFCTYCVVPYTRGPLVNRNYKDILKEVESLIKKEIKEIWLLGQNVNSYKSKNVNFPRLLRMINNIKGDFWIRFTSSHPKDFSEDLIKAIKECEKVTEYLNLPVQSGNNEILKKMNRPYNVKQYKEMIKKVRKEIPDICISTDIIVGFPGETEKQFQNTVNLFKEIEFDMAYISQYSHREKPIKIKDDISSKEKKERKKILTEILKETALKNNKKHIKRREKILISQNKNNSLIGKDRFYKTVKIEGGFNSVGNFINVEITDAMHWGLKGKIIKN